MLLGRLLREKISLVRGWEYLIVLGYGDVNSGGEFFCVFWIVRNSN